MAKVRILLSLTKIITLTFLLAVKFEWKVQHMISINDISQNEFYLQFDSIKPKKDQLSIWFTKHSATFIF